jgi:hypothetical protein
VSFSAGGKVIAEGSPGDGKARAAETSKLNPAALPDEVTLRDAAGPYLRLSSLRYGGAPPANAFTHGNRLYFAWYDGQPEPTPVGWRSVSALWTVSDARPAAIGDVPAFAEPQAADPALLRDPGFEGAGSLKVVSLRTGQPLPRRFGEAAWTAPAGGKLVPDPRHGGRLSAEVVGQEDDYRLWRQALTPGAFPPGSKWRLSAWVKGEGLSQGDVGWKAACIRLEANTGQMQYASSPGLLDTFDWRLVTVEWTAPEGLQGLSVGVGNNGGGGRVWVDDVRLERVE